MKVSARQVRKRAVFYLVMAIVTAVVRSWVMVQRFGRAWPEDIAFTFWATWLALNGLDGLEYSRAFLKEEEEGEKEEDEDE